MQISKSIFAGLFLSLVTSTAFAAVNGPVKTVTLSSGGLAEIVRSADVGSIAEITIDVPLDQVDDILKSIVVRDDKGHVKSLSLAGPNPLEETFRTLPFKPSDLTSLPGLLNSIKGSRVQAGDKQGVVLGVTDIPATDKLAQSWQLSLMTDDGGVVMVPIPGTAITIVDPAIKAKLQTAMGVIAKGNIDGARTISIALDGAANRSVDISYVVPAPIWKTSYRLVTSKDGTVRLQAWAIFENASGEDWNDVGVTLSSGKPVTLQQHLHSHFWKQRTEVPVDTTSVAVDQVRRPMMSRAMGASMAPPAPVPMMMDALAAPKAQNFEMAQAAEQPLTEEGDVTSTFTLPGTFDLKNGDTLSVPILDKGIMAEMISLYRPQSGGEHPTAAAMIDNDAGVSLPAGIMTVYDGKQGYVGDAQINGLPTGEKQAVSYAVDQKVSISSDVQSTTNINSIKVDDGMLSTSSITKEATIYKIAGASDADRTVLIESPKRSGWAFSGDDAISGTPTSDRIKTNVKAGETKSVTATYSITTEESYALASAEPGMIVQWQGAATDEAVKAKLRSLAAARASQTEANRVMETLDRNYAKAEKEQQRTRDNLKAVGEGDTKARFEKQLNALEDTMASIEKQRSDQRVILDGVTDKVGELVKTF